MNSRVLVIDEADLRRLVREELSAVLTQERPPVEAPPAIVDREQLAHALGVSAKTVDRLRKRAGFPQLLLGDSPRFEVDAVLAWLKVSGTPLRLVKGGS